MQEAKKVFREYLAKQGLKSTRQREIILDEFLRCVSHPSTEDLYIKLRKNHPQIGYATVHRTLKLLAECGLAEGHNFGDGQTRYESCIDEKHHDHLVCTRCGAIMEFYDPRIEALQEEVAKTHGFTIRNHRLELYGLCSQCDREQ